MNNNLKENLQNIKVAAENFTEAVKSFSDAVKAETEKSEKIPRPCWFAFPTSMETHIWVSRIDEKASVVMYKDGIDLVAMICGEGTKQGHEIASIRLLEQGRGDILEAKDKAWAWAVNEYKRLKL